jgi:hypothetical protein
MTQNAARGHSAEEWSQMSTKDRVRVYRERDRQQSVSNVVVVGQQQDNPERQWQPAEDMSVITTLTSALAQQNQQRSVASMRSTLDEISEVMNRRNRHVGAIYSSVRRIVSDARSVKSTPPDMMTDTVISCRAELDSHADTCAVNDTAYIFGIHGRCCRNCSFCSLISENG